MDFVYLPHPRAISWLCWRKPGKTDQTFAMMCLPFIHNCTSAFLKNVLLTSCKDNIGRLWSETSNDEGFFFFTTGEINLTEYSTNIHEASPLVLHWINPLVCVARLLIAPRHTVQEMHDFATAAPGDGPSPAPEPSESTLKLPAASSAHLVSSASVADRIATSAATSASSKEDWRVTGRNFIRKAITEPHKPFDKLFRKHRPSPLTHVASGAGRDELPSPVKASWRVATGTTAHVASRTRIDSRPVSAQRSKVGCCI